MTFYQFAAENPWLVLGLAALTVTWPSMCVAEGLKAAFRRK